MTDSSGNKKQPPFTLPEALVAFQASVPAIERSKSVKVQTKTGGSYSFSYAPHEAILAAIQTALADCGLAVSQPLGFVDGRHVLRTILFHSSGERLEDVWPLAIDGHQTAQEIGSLITYMRRYALVSILGLATEDDDDGNRERGNRVKTATDALAEEVPPLTAQELTNQLLAAAEKLGALTATREAINKNAAKGDAAGHIAWLQRCLATAEENLAEREKSKASPFKKPPEKKGEK